MKFKNGISMALGAVLVAILAGCYVEGGGVVGGPVFLGGGYYERGHDVHVYSHRGYESRRVAHHEWHGHR